MKVNYSELFSHDVKQTGTGQKAAKLFDLE